MVIKEKEDTHGKPTVVEKLDKPDTPFVLSDRGKISFPLTPSLSQFRTISSTPITRRLEKG